MDTIFSITLLLVPCAGILGAEPVAKCRAPLVGRLVTMVNISDVGVQRFHLRCPDMYATEGESIIECKYNKITQKSRWKPDPSRFTCYYPCTVPNLPEGLRASPSDLLISSGENVNFTCAEGKLNGAETVRCHNGTLLPTIPTCDLQHGNIRIKNGRVLVHFNGIEGSICFTKEWDIHNANVVCRQLGLSPYAISATSIPFGHSNDLIHFDSVRCQGYEDKLIDCGLSFSPCETRLFAGVVCLEGDESASEGSVRLIEQAGDEIPLVEMYFDGIWGAVCAGACNHDDTSCTDQWSSDERADWLCQELGYNRASAVSINSQNSKNELQEDTFIILDCPKDATALGECPHYYPNKDVPCESGVVHVSCEAEQLSLRLINGSTKDKGRLEIYDGEHWRTVPLFKETVTPVLICEHLTGKQGYVQAVDGKFGYGLVSPKHTYSCPDSADSLSECQVEEVGDDLRDASPLSLYCTEESEAASLNPRLICLTAFGCTLVIVVIAVIIRLYHHKKRVAYRRMGSQGSYRHNNPKSDSYDDDPRPETQKGTSKTGGLVKGTADNISDTVFND